MALTRGVPQGAHERSWNPRAPDPALFEGASAVVHLAGATLARRWTSASRREIRESRVEATRLLVAALARATRRPRVLIAASAVGLYGDRGDETLEESSLPGSGFLATLVRDWEAAAAEAESADVRVVRLRLGLVVAPRGGALARLRPLFALGLGGPPGSGRQWWSWIAIEDVLGIVDVALEDVTFSGAINAVAPHPVTAREFARALGRALGRPVFMRAPAALLRLALGEMADELPLASQRAVPARLLERRWMFRFPEIEGALRHAVGRAHAIS